jgi:hypothetical protein
LVESDEGRKAEPEGTGEFDWRQEEWRGFEDSSSVLEKWYHHVPTSVMTLILNTLLSQI